MAPERRGGFREPVMVISNAGSAIYASGGHDGWSCMSRPSAAVPLVALPGIYLSTCARGCLRPMGRVLRIVRERARVYARFRRDST